MKKINKLIGLIFIMILYSNFIEAFIVIPVSHPERYDNNCFPPINFSISHNCELRYSYAKSVNAFDCGCCKVVGDCNGDIIEYECNQTKYCPSFRGVISSKSGMILLGTMILEIIIIISIFIYYKKRKKDTYPYY